MLKTLHTRHNQILRGLLRSLRESQRLRQADLADRLGCAQATVSKVESGERRLDLIELRDWLYAMESNLPAFVNCLEAELQFHGANDMQVRRRKADRAQIGRANRAPSRK